MIEALVSGKLIRDPSTKIGPSGKPFCNFMLSVNIGDENAVFVSGIAFGEASEKIGALGKGDALSVAGALKPSTWNDKATGEERHGLNITVSACLSAYDARKKTPAKAQAGKPARPPQYQPPEDTHGFDDPLDF
ncbi:MAG: single-stranded DNA-binding protein [Candidatus Methylumidiphilus sp.]